MADNKTNLIMEEIELPRPGCLPRLGIFGKSPSPRPGSALVLFQAGQPLVTIKPGQKMTLGEMRFGGYKTAYEVDLREKSFNFTCCLPSQNAAYEFQAEVRASYCVDDPAAVVENRVENPAETLRPLMTQTLRNKSREYPIEAVHQAEPGLTSTLKQANYGRGLKITEAVVTLKLDQSARDYVRKLDDMQRQRDIKLKEIRHQKELQREQAELEQQTEEQRQELLQQRLNFYTPHIQRGEWQMLGLLLANNPQDVGAVAQMVRDQRQQDFENFLRAIQAMLDQDVLESFELEPAKQQVLKGFLQSLSSQTEGAPAGLPGGEERKALDVDENDTQEPDADESED